MKKFVSKSNLYKNFRDVISSKKNKCALVLGDLRITYKELGEKVDSFANGLDKLGIKKGENVGIILPGSIEYIISIFALLKIGAPLIPINPQLRIIEVKKILEDSNTVAVIVPTGKVGFDYVDMIESIQLELKNLRNIIGLGNETRKGVTPFYSLYLRVKKPNEINNINPDDLACITYTSGTTGVPKGVVDSHQTKLSLIKIIVDSIEEEYLSARLNPYPLFTSAGLDITLQTIISGNKLVIMDRYNPNQMLSTLENEEVTMADGTPEMITQVLSAIKRKYYNLSSLKAIATGGSLATPDFVNNLINLTGLKFINFYGLTEVGIAAVLSPDAPIEKKLNTVGRPPKDVEIKIVDEDRIRLPFDKIGEITVRSPANMVGYYKNPTITKESFDEEGFYYTGDYGSLDSDGYLRIRGRKKDIIIRGGQNISPAEIESYLNSHPQIEMSAVVGLPSKLIGEKVCAFIKTAEGINLSRIAILEFCRGNIASYKIPDEIFFIDSFPMGDAMKVQKSRLRELAIENLENP
jgi:fatty-acyl-CoA synthase/long-chain acyl-CoA synthetase